MRYFFDSSVLAKLFLREQGTAAVTLFVEQTTTGNLICSQLAILEVRSAIQRKQHLREITITHAQQGLRLLQAEMQHWNVIPVDTHVFAAAAASVDRVPQLRSLDAIQLGTAILLSQNEPITFVVADKRYSKPPVQAVWQR